MVLRLALFSLLAGSCLSMGNPSSNSLVKSAVGPACRRSTMYFSRMQLITTILCLVSTVSCPPTLSKITHNPPRRKMPAIAILCDRGTWTFDTSQTGNEMIRASTTILGIEFPMKNLFLSMHFPSSMKGFQALSMGVHWKMVVNTMAIHQARVSPPRT